MSIPYLACMTLVANLYGIPPRVLPAIQRVEGGQVGSVSRNRDGSEDLGVMQVNTRWIPALAAYTGESEAVVRHRLIHDACYNIAAAGAIFRHKLDRRRGDVVAAVGDYHSRTPARHEAYLGRIAEAARRLFPDTPPAAPPPR
ncbi:MAG: lytic transglycosylase domain-containing protein [Roseococcus sp.]|jgi:soluble lytic murein transglycosylase-like protein